MSAADQEATPAPEPSNDALRPEVTEATETTAIPTAEPLEHDELFAPLDERQVSPFDPAVYSGIADSVSRERRKHLEEDKRRARTLGVFVTVALIVGGLLGGTAGGAFAIWNLSARGLVTPGVSSPATITVNSPLDASEITAVAASALPSVVTIEVVGSTGAGSGSGVIISADGHVMTNAHVVTLGAQEPAIRITMSDGRLFSATVVGRDVLSDIAVLKIDASGPSRSLPWGTLMP